MHLCIMLYILDASECDICLSYINEPPDGRHN